MNKKKMVKLKKIMMHLHFLIKSIVYVYII